MKSESGKANRSQQLYAMLVMDTKKTTMTLKVQNELLFIVLVEHLV